MFLERIAIFTLQVRAKLQTLIKFLLRETDSQVGQIFFTCCLFFLTGLLIYTWLVPSALWVKLSFSFIYILSLLLIVTAIHFILQRKRIRKNINVMEVYIVSDQEQENFQKLHLNSIALTEVQAKAIFTDLSVKYISGTYKSFQSLILLKAVPFKERLIWKDLSPKGPKQVNRQTLLEFLSNLLAGFENLENHQIMELVNHYFILRNASGTEQTLSTKNISDWRMNKAAYLKEISQLFQQHL